MNNLDLKITNPNAHFKKPLVNEGKYSNADKKKLAKASQEFESMLTSMMIKSMTKNTEGLFGKDNYGGDVLDVLFESEMANFITKTKGMGIADKIYESMTGEPLSSIPKLNNEILLKKNFSVNNKNESKPLTNAVGKTNSAMKRLEKYNQIIEEASNKYNVDEKLIKSVILTESSAKENAKSHANAKGLMQLMDSTATAMGVNDPWDPKENIHGGTKYLSKLLNLYNGNEDKALAAYNAGMGNVKKYNGIPPFTETRNYIERVKFYLNNME